MSAYSTIKITRSRARWLIISSVMGLSDEILARYLDEILEPKLYNAQIVGDDQESDDALTYVP